MDGVEDLSMAETTKQDVIDFIANMSVLELSELVSELEDQVRRIRGGSGCHDGRNDAGGRRRCGSGGRENRI